MIMLLYDMKFRIISFDMIGPSSSVLFVPMYFLVSINDGAKILSHFLLWKVCNRPKLNDLKILDPQNTHEKTSLAHKILRRKHFGPMKFPQENFLDPQRHNSTITLWHIGTRPMEFSTIIFFWDCLRGLSLRMSLRKTCFEVVFEIS